MGNDPQWILIVYCFLYMPLHKQYTYILYMPLDHTYGDHFSTNRLNWYEYLHKEYLYICNELLAIDLLVHNAWVVWVELKTNGSDIGHKMLIVK